jgi:hypothetical protein
MQLRAGMCYPGRQMIQRRELPAYIKKKVPDSFGGALHGTGQTLCRKNSAPDSFKNILQE